jgi:hypothetical protein
LFVVKLASDGDHIWSRGFHGNLDAPSIAVDGAGNVVVSGDIQTTVDFGGGPLSGTLTVDIFVARFDPDGNHLWSDRFGDDGVDRGRGLAVSSGGNIHVTGHFQNTLDFGGQLLVSTGNVDLFIAKFGDPNVAVAIGSFDARVFDGGVALYGSFTSNLRILGVNIYRAEDDGRLLLYNNVSHSGGEFYYEDRHVESGRTYHYRIGVVDQDGEFFSQIATVKTQSYVTDLLPNVPNPFNPATSIRFTLEKAVHVTLSIHDVKGRRVTTLIDELRGAGLHETRWDGTDASGTILSSGVYFSRMRAGNASLSRRMVLLK